VLTLSPGQGYARLPSPPLPSARYDLPLIHADCGGAASAHLFFREVCGPFVHGFESEMTNEIRGVGVGQTPDERIKVRATTNIDKLGARGVRYWRWPGDWRRQVDIALCGQTTAVRGVIRSDLIGESAWKLRVGCAPLTLNHHHSNPHPHFGFCFATPTHCSPPDSRHQMRLRMKG
jgi:hypothetical protein